MTGCLMINYFQSGNHLNNHDAADFSELFSNSDRIIHAGDTNREMADYYGEWVQRNYPEYAKNYRYQEVTNYHYLEFQEEMKDRISALRTRNVNISAFGRSKWFY